MQEPNRVDGVAGRKYPSLLEGFTDGHIINGSYETSCIYRKGGYCYCLMALTGPVSVLSVQSVVKKKSRVKPYVLLLSNSPAETDFPVEPRILD